MRNEITVDGQVKKDVDFLYDKVVFVISVPTHQDEITRKDVNTFIKVFYTGEVNDKLKDILKPNNYIRVYGKLDSEKFITRNDKTVYNKIIVTDNVCLLEYDRQYGVYVEAVI